MVHVSVFLQGLDWYVLRLQALEHYGESICVGHQHILQSLPRLSHSTFC
jgi:hypothetical protein